LKINKRKYFGTDGIRGSISKETNPEFILKLGWAAGSIFKEEGIHTLIIGKDTRISGYMLETALQAGIIAAGVNVRLVGPMPTPAISYLANSFKKQAGVVISASHNSYEDNGIKFFGDDGKKISDLLEQKIEKKLDEEMTVVDAKSLGKAERISDANGRYIEFCKSSLKRDINFSSLKIVLDVANGAAYDVAPKVFRELGAELIVIADKPDGLNINKDCGSTNIEFLKNEVKKHSADYGLALDGDGDRLIFVDENSEEIDGDEVLFILARDKFENQITLGSKGVVGTTMTNKGLEIALKEFGIDSDVKIVSAHRTPEVMFEYAKNARTNGIKVIIAGAGGAAHLPGMVASISTLPIIGVPIKSRNSIDGWDSILSILQMPEGVPVATVALNGASNAGIIAAQILGIEDSSIFKKLSQYKERLKEKVIKTNKDLT
jgi:phosphoglucosamine mutase